MKVNAVDRAKAERVRRRAGSAADDARQDRWDALSMTKQVKLLDEWNDLHPPRPGEDLRDRVAARLEWCLETLGRRST